ncbi:glutamine-hydrolyzing carbamoyl-phosphate synthase small subunit [bacterium]|nr:glutamine-hydrolyzing carbamoyl-phosphate synthase small subunit [bacterium]NCQ55583.1 glutamine-hydrolyzing carbamoyl-phosphate synthase small subunit [Candidatus Parcubacteria bacterium]NCS67408.1 glutamine-hydrolyzing carbamoyl-phosphate synthase small subunit [Candidatus Peregrinibacteria bacterium]NCS96134.1 glutamine-hydrolyzing carbamoyl-phosphate synthase small subunit [bacterium]
MKKLHLASGESFSGSAFGADAECLGEVVFTTGMTGYLETLTDPSYFGQIVVFTFPLIGNYGVFEPKQMAPGVDETYESQQIWVKGVVLTEWSEAFSHHQAFQDFSAWLKANNIPALSNVDTRELTQTLRESGCIMGNIGESPALDFTDKLNGRYVPEVAPTEVTVLEPTKGDIGKTVAFVDCGAKNGIFRNFLDRGVKVIRFPFDANPYDSEYEFDGIFFSNGPGDPETVTETIETMKIALQKEKPIFGICLGNQMLGLAAGGKTEKMKYGHRGVNQPVEDLETNHCIVTTQNHGYVVAEDSLPADFKVWFKNLNDNSVEGIKHKTKPIFAVQFHPEACAGPEDAQYLFETFINTL